MDARLLVCLRALALAAGAVLVAPAARAESLRCAGGIAAEGDTRLAVVYKCGQPLYADTFCAPLYLVGSPPGLPPEPYVGPYAPCVQTDEWLYDRGPGNLVATVRFRSGIVQSIAYGREPH